MKYSWIWGGVGVFALGIAVFGFTFLDHAPQMAKKALSVFSSNPAVYPEYTGSQIENDEDINTEKKERIPFTLYYDFTCPHCKEFYIQTFTPLQSKYADQFDFSILPYPLRTNGKSMEMSSWLICAEEQKNESLIVPFIEQVSTENTAEEVIELLVLENPEEFLLCIDEERTKENIAELRKKAQEKGVRGTPTFFIGDTKYERNQSLKKVELEIYSLINMQ